MNARLPSTLSEKEARALVRLEHWLHTTMPDQVERLILFGSKARGDAHPESDVDVALVLREATHERRARVQDFTVDLMLEEEPVDLTAIVYDHTELQHLADIGAPLVRNIAEEGIPLVGEGIKVGKGKPEEVVRAFLNGAHERLISARVLIDAGQWRDAVSRAYYAVLDAADGALAATPITPKSHAGTLNLFSLRFIQAGRVEGRYGRLLNHIQKSRLEADYERMAVITESNAREALAEAEDFVAMVECLLPDLLKEEEANDGEIGDAAQPDSE